MVIWLPPAGFSDGVCVVSCISCANFCSIPATPELIPLIAVSRCWNWALFSASVACGCAANCCGCAYAGCGCAANCCGCVYAGCGCAANCCGCAYAGCGCAANCCGC
ncbi:hypothetical protein FVI95_18360, partial [Salmonella enterica subsp. enterica serovar Hvittingfoss]|nr:hypothetical protein [Salmonella enterica subsp. enterica serovar Hvittingfoss]